MAPPTLRSLVSALSASEKLLQFVQKLWSSRKPLGAFGIFGILGLVGGLVLFSDCDHRELVRMVKPGCTEHIRAVNPCPPNTRTMSGSENELRLSQLPRGVCGWVRSDSAHEADPVVHADPGSGHTLQVRKSAHGEVAYAGFVSEDARALLQREDLEDNQHVMFYSAPRNGATKTVALDPSQLSDPARHIAKREGGCAVEVWDVVSAAR